MCGQEKKQESPVTVMSRSSERLDDGNLHGEQCKLCEAVRFCVYFLRVKSTGIVHALDTRMRETSLNCLLGFGLNNWMNAYVMR